MVKMKKAPNGSQFERLHRLRFLIASKTSVNLWHTIKLYFSSTLLYQLTSKHHQLHQKSFLMQAAALKKLEWVFSSSGANQISWNPRRVAVKNENLREAYPLIHVLGEIDLTLFDTRDSRATDFRMSCGRNGIPRQSHERVISEIGLMWCIGLRLK